MRINILGVLVLAATAAAQQASPQLTQQVIRIQGKQLAESVSVMPGTAPMLARISGASSIVKGAPYSAEATTEIIQVLADGNRIVSKTTNKSYRDSQGRTRMEITPSPAGAWMPDTKQFSITVIDDPVSGDHITLNNNNKLATRFSVKEVTTTSSGVAGAAGRAQNMTFTIASGSDVAGSLAPVPPPGAHSTAARFTTGYAQAGGVMSVTMSDQSDVKFDTKKEDLGKQEIEGVVCNGSKETTTIPAGAVGNERVIETATEHWYSPELQQEVLTKTTDPRFGETSYRLGNIVRSEQPRSLFEVPSDYKLEEPSLDRVKVERDTKQQ
jgi:hypothetical protein